MQGNPFSQIPYPVNMPPVMPGTILIQGFFYKSFSFFDYLLLIHICYQGTVLWQVFKLLKNRIFFHLILFYLIIILCTQTYLVRIIQTYLPIGINMNMGEFIFPGMKMLLFQNTSFDHGSFIY